MPSMGRAPSRVARYCRGTGDAKLMMRASPLSDIVSHCQPTVTRAGSTTEGVEQVKTTSFPIGPVSSDEAAITGTHVHVRPAESVTVRPAIAPPANHMNELDLRIWKLTRCSGHDRGRGRPTRTH
jgi:hypothetical protein